jgi:hypothetical protein
VVVGGTATENGVNGLVVMLTPLMDERVQSRSESPRPISSERNIVNL